MALTEDDEGLVQELRQLLRENGAAWIEDEVDASLASLGIAELDATVEAEALLVAISRSLGALPAMLVEASETLRSHSPDVAGVLLGDKEISFTESDAELRMMTEAAAVITAAVEHLLQEPPIDE